MPPCKVAHIQPEQPKLLLVVMDSAMPRFKAQPWRQHPHLQAHWKVQKDLDRKPDAMPL
jgi:hypothetical protein